MKHVYIALIIIGVLIVVGISLSVVLLKPNDNSSNKNGSGKDTDPKDTDPKDDDPKDDEPEDDEPEDTDPEKPIPKEFTNGVKFFTGPYNHDGLTASCWIPKYTTYIDGNRHSSIYSFRAQWDKKEGLQFTPHPIGSSKYTVKLKTVGQNTFFEVPNMYSGPSKVTIVGLNGDIIETLLTYYDSNGSTYTLPPKDTDRSEKTVIFTRKPVCDNIDFSCYCH